jgi:hypothetical protein
MDFLSLLSGYIDIGGVLLGIILTQFVRYLLPTPKDAGSKFDVGPLAYRILPVLPLIIGALTVVIKDGLVSPTLKIDEAIVKGLVSGGAAAYLFRTAKVIIWGKEKTNGGLPTPDDCKELVDKVSKVIKEEK